MALPDGRIDMAEKPHPDVRDLLKLMDESSIPDLDELPPAEAREPFDELDLVPEEEHEPVADIRNRTIPGPARNIVADLGADLRGAFDD